MPEDFEAAREKAVRNSKLDQFDWPARPKPPTCRVTLMRQVGNVVYTKSLRMKLIDVPAFIVRRAVVG